MVPLEELILCTVKCDFAKMNLKISQLDLITKTTQWFNYNVESLMNLNTPTTYCKGGVC